MKESRVMTTDGKRAVEEMMVRLDELNDAAPNLDPVLVARRLLHLTDDLVDALYPSDSAIESDDGRPMTGYIYRRLYQFLRSDEEVDEAASYCSRQDFREVPFTEEDKQADAG